MKDGTAKWTVGITLKSRFADSRDPATVTRYSVTGAYTDADGKCSGLESMARDLARIIATAQDTMIPSRRADIAAAFADELRALRVGIEE